MFSCKESISRWNILPSIFLSLKCCLKPKYPCRVIQPLHIVARYAHWPLNSNIDLSQEQQQFFPKASPHQPCPSFVKPWPGREGFPENLFQWSEAERTNIAKFEKPATTKTDELLQLYQERDGKAWHENGKWKSGKWKNWKWKSGKWENRKWNSGKM